MNLSRNSVNLSYNAKLFIISPIDVDNLVRHFSFLSSLDPVLQICTPRGKISVDTNGFLFMFRGHDPEAKVKPVIQTD